MMTASTIVTDRIRAQRRMRRQVRRWRAGVVMHRAVSAVFATAFGTLLLLHSL